MTLGLLSDPAAAASGAKPQRHASPRAEAASLASDGARVVEIDPEAEPRRPVTHDPEILNRTEMLSLVTKLASEIANALLDGELQREQAVHTRDAIKLSCIQDRLSNMKLMKKLSDQRLAATDRPEIRADDLNLRHEFRGVELAHERVTELHKELLECVGESLEVTVTTSSGAPAPNVSVSADPASTNVEVPKVDRPPPASVYR